MNRLTKLPTQTCVIGVFALAGLAAAANPMAAFVDCTDSFWEIACEAEVESSDIKVESSDIEVESADIELVPLGERVRIDYNATCTELPNGLLACHS